MFFSCCDSALSSHENHDSRVWNAKLNVSTSSWEYFLSIELLSPPLYVEKFFIELVQLCFHCIHDVLFYITLKHSLKPTWTCLFSQPLDARPLGGK